MALIPLKNEELQKAGIPFKAQTLYKWRKEKRNLQIFVKIGGRVFVNAEEWEKLIEEARERSRAEAEKAEELRKILYT